MRYLLSLLCLLGCTSVVTATLPISSLERLNQLEKKPEVYLPSPAGHFLATNNTRIYISLKDGREIFVFAAEVFVNNDRIILRGRDQEILLSDITEVKFVDRY